MVYDLRHFNHQVPAGESEVWTPPAFHELRGGLRQRSDYDWQRDRGVAVNVRS